MEKRRGTGRYQKREVEGLIETNCEIGGDKVYWFYMLKEIDEDTSNTIEQDVFIAESREDAKRYLKEKFGDIPFRKPKNAPNETKYIYLTESSQYWYDRLYKEVRFPCSWCGKETTVIGEKNIIRSYLGEYCSEECKNTAHEKANKEWINENDHVGLGNCDKSKLAGYIYKITNKRTMKCYVGQTVKPPLFRWWQHLKIDQKFEQADLTELVFEVLEIVEYNPKLDTVYGSAQDKLNKREAHYIALFNSVEEGYNSVQPKEFEHDLFTISSTY